MDERVDVLVVGAGPVGPLNVVALTLGDVRVLVPERPAAVSTVMKAMAVGTLGIPAAGCSRTSKACWATARALGIAVRREVDVTDLMGLRQRGSFRKRESLKCQR
jgi:2-polyprenyl-6-methoxyphenol hydroxylase-like FAD-dependent oxidoreductase